MEKISTSAKIDRMRRAIEAGEYAEALKLVQTVDVLRLKSTADMSVCAEAYYRNQDFEKALACFEQVYQKNQTRRILINLINLCLKLSMTDMAESYLRDFVQMAPNDFYRHIFRYRIDKLRNEALDVLIFDLEMLKEENYMEDWAYELAKLYHKSGQKEKCIAECSDIILWFGSGTYVERARALRAYYLAESSQGALSEREAALANEVQRLVSAGRSAEEVESFIEETTTVMGGTSDYSEADYRSERYGQPPVYEEKGKEVVWKTTEFGSVTEKVEVIENTMDWIKGMQVAEQIRMTLDENQEVMVEKLPEEDWKEYPEELTEEDFKECPEERSQEFLKEENREAEPGAYAEAEEEPKAAGADLPGEAQETEADVTDISLPEEMEEQLEEDISSEISKVMEDESIVFSYPEELTLRYFPEEGTELSRLLEQKNVCLNDYFGVFLSVSSVRRQLIRSLEQIFDSRHSGVALIITGEEQSGKTVLGKAIAKSMQALGRMKSPKVAIIDAKKLNLMCLSDRAKQLEDMTLIIENAGDLSSERTKELLSLSPVFAGKTVVILEDERTRMNQLLRNEMDLNGAYNNRIHLPKWSAKDLYMAGLMRFIQNDYKLTKDAAEVLQNTIDRIVRQDGATAYENVMTYTENAMKKAEKRMTESLKEQAAIGRYMDADLMMVRKEDME